MRAEFTSQLQRQPIVGEGNAGLLGAVENGEIRTDRSVAPLNEGRRAQD